MPELPEVEVLMRHLQPLLKGRSVVCANVRRPKALAPTTVREFETRLSGSRFVDLKRRGKFMRFELCSTAGKTFTLLGHLGMTGRMFVLPEGNDLPKHTAVELVMDSGRFIFQDVRGFGRLTFDTSSLETLGPEPLEDVFTVEVFTLALKTSSQAIKVKLLDQACLAGVGNIYASESLFRAGISPRHGAKSLRPGQVAKLHAAIREVLTEAIAFGSTVPLDWSGKESGDGLFYYGATESGSYEERLLVYDREGEPCVRCATAIRRIVQAARSTFYCPKCQKG